MQLRNVDYNLLMPLRTLLEERSVSRAAERMHMSQPALSAALARLRRHFNDELLQRNGNSYQLTPLALQLLDRSYSATRSLERLFSAQAEFDPSTSTREFSIFCSDYVMAALGGALVSALVEEAPLTRLRFHPMNSTVVSNAPDSLRDYDGMMMPHGFLSDHPHQDLYTDRWVCVVDPGNSVVGDRLTTEDMSRLPWVSTFSGPTEYTPAGKQVQLMGIDPHIEVISTSFLVIPHLLARTDRIALLQELPARQFEAQGSVRVLELPFEVIPLVETFWWNSVHDRDPEHLWLRGMLKVAVARAGLAAHPEDP